MKQMATCLTDQQETVTLGSVVAFDGQHGVVWYLGRDALRVLRLTRRLSARGSRLLRELAPHGHQKRADRRLRLG